MFGREEDFIRAAILYCSLTGEKLTIVSPTEDSAKCLMEKMKQISKDLFERIEEGTMENKAKNQLKISESGKKIQIINPDESVEIVFNRSFVSEFQLIAKDPWVELERNEQTVWSSAWTPFKMLEKENDELKEKLQRVVKKLDSKCEIIQKLEGRNKSENETLRGAQNTASILRGSMQRLSSYLGARGISVPDPGFAVDAAKNCIDYLDGEIKNLTALSEKQKEENEKIQINLQQEIQSLRHTNRDQANFIREKNKEIERLRIENLSMSQHLKKMEKKDRAIVALTKQKAELESKVTTPVTKESNAEYPECKKDDHENCDCSFCSQENTPENEEPCNHCDLGVTRCYFQPYPRCKKDDHEKCYCSDCEYEDTHGDDLPCDNCDKDNGEGDCYFQPKQKPGKIKDARIVIDDKEMTLKSITPKFNLDTP